MEKNQNGGIIKLVTGFDTISFHISRIACVVCGVMLIFVTLMICAGVLNRLFFHQIWVFVEEWSGLILVPMSYLAFGFTMRENKHLRMDLVVRSVPDRWKNILAIFSSVFGLLCMIYLIGFSWTWLDYCITRNALSSGPMETPLWVFSLSILVGMIILAIDLLCFFLGRIIYAVTGQSPLRFKEQIGEQSEQNLSDVM
ncbi:MAG: TRAP transporter small permease [Lentihominibacter sp.]|jgi:C4-dicarboxylate transporter DctQ subunit